MKLLIKLVLRDSLPRIESLKAFFHAGVVDAQEFVLCGGHVDKVRLALAAFLVEELVHRLIYRGFSQVSTDDLIQRFPQMRRAAFGRRDALGAVLAGLVYSRINTRETDDGAAARKTAHITDFSHKLRGSGFANAVHGAHGIVLRQLHCKARHLGAQSGQRHLACKQLLGSSRNEQFRVVVLRQRGEMAAASGVNVQCFFCAEMVALAFAPLLVALGECLFAGAADAVAVPKGHDKVHPFLVTVCTLWAGEQFVHAGKGLVGQRNEVVLQRYHRFHVEVVLAAAQLQLLSYRVHRSIFLQIHPVVKAVLGNFHGICLVGLDLADGAAPTLLNEQRIEDADI